MIRILILVVTFFFQCQAVALELRGPLVQGALITGRTVPGSSVFLDGIPVATSANGTFVFGLSRNANSKVLLAIYHLNGKLVQKVLKIRKRLYKVQRVNGLPKNKVTPAKRDYKKILREKRVQE